MSVCLSAVLTSLIFDSALLELRNGPRKHELLLAPHPFDVKWENLALVTGDRVVFDTLGVSAACLLILGYAAGVLGVSMLASVSAVSSLVL